MTRDVANRFNNAVGETLVAPQAKIQENGKLVPGTDGEKMSKSRNNIINIFLPDKKLRKQIMSIKTDSKGLEEPKDPENDNVFGLYKLLASNAEITEMRANYKGGNYGYGQAKQALYEIIIEKFATIRKRYNHFMENKHEIDEALEIGAEKATIVATGVLQRVRAKIGY
jgi:tryptophanyl-tRNA synthetase